MTSSAFSTRSVAATPMMRASGESPSSARMSVGAVTRCGMYAVGRTRTFSAGMPSSSIMRLRLDSDTATNRVA